MAWKIRKPIQGRHLRAKYKDMVQAYTNILTAYKQLYEQFLAKDNLIQLATPDQKQQIILNTPRAS